MGVGREQAFVVDGDDALRGIVASHLAGEGYAVTEASAVRAALGAMEETPADIVIVDLDLPDMDGVDVVRAVRRATDGPLIVVSSRSADIDSIAALDAGADDYMVKPLSVAELMARVRAVARRARPSPAEDGLRFGELLIDRRSREVRVGDTRVALTHREFDLLAYLASSPGQVFSREQLLEQVWGSSSAW